MSTKTKTSINRATPTTGPTTNQIFRAALRAGFWGGLAISALLLVYQISFPLKMILIPPALITVWIVTGIGAAMLMDAHIRTSRDSSKVGAIAGIISGTIGGITAMIVAAFGQTFAGLGIMEQFTAAQVNALANSGLTERVIVLSGQIIAALFTCGIGGIVVSALLGWLGGWLYPRLNR